MVFSVLLDLCGYVVKSELFGVTYKDHPEQRGIQFHNFLPRLVDVGSKSSQLQLKPWALFIKTTGRPSPFSHSMGNEGEGRRSTVPLLSNYGALLLKKRRPCRLALFEQNLTQGQVRCIHSTQDALPRLLQSISCYQWVTCGHFS